MIPQDMGSDAQREDDCCLPFAAAADHHLEEDTHHIIDGDDEYDDACDLPFALGDSHGLSESFMKANEALGLSLAATTISTRSAGSDLTGSYHGESCASSPRHSHENLLTPAQSAHMYADPSSPSCSNRSHGQQQQQQQQLGPSPHCISQTPLKSGKSSSRVEYFDDYDQQPPSAAAAAAAEAAAAMIPANSKSSFILQSPLAEEHGNVPSSYPSLQRRESPPVARDDTTCAAVGSSTSSQAESSRDMSSVLMTPLFPHQQTTDNQTATTDHQALLTSSDATLTSLGFSDLMRKAAAPADGMDDSFTILNAPLRPVIEESASHDDACGNGKEQDSGDDAQTCDASTSTPPISNIGGATIVPPGEEGGGSTLDLATGGTRRQQQQQHPNRGLSMRRRSQYRTMGPSIQTTQLSQDSFAVSTHLPPPVTVREVIDALANPDLLRLWCVPVKNAIITREGGGGGGGLESGSSDSGNANREYDGEWVEITTPQLVSPSSSCMSCLHKGLSAMKAVLGFPSHGSVKMFVERNRGQVGLSVGPFMGDMVADHTITVGDNCALAASVDGGGDGSVIPSASSGVVITDTVRIHKDEHADGGGGYSCGLFGKLEKCILPSIAGYMTQAALSLENLCDVVCDGEACALASSATCSIDFGLGDDGSDGRTPLLAHN